MEPTIKPLPDEDDDKLQPEPQPQPQPEPVIGHWALVNFILMMCSICCLVKLDSDKHMNIFNLVFAVASVILFVFTEFTNLPMVLVDNYTWVMAVLCICAFISALFHKPKQDKI